jgi:hypothetical protein
MSQSSGSMPPSATARAHQKMVKGLEGRFAGQAGQERPYAIV